jgi:septal ring factor EnvC (AmiA/AmiB activator)
VLRLVSLRRSSRLQELDKQMEIMHKKIWEQRQKMGGVNASRENNQAIAKQIQILENRLDKALKRYNEALANNKRLRQNIDNLRRERLVFDQIYRKLEKEVRCLASPHPTPHPHHLTPTRSAHSRRR